MHNDEFHKFNTSPKILFLDFLSGFLLLATQAKMLYKLNIFTMRVTCPAYPLI